MAIKGYKSTQHMFEHLRQWCKEYTDDYSPIEKVDLIGKNHPFYGQHHTEETKSKMRSKKIGLKKMPLSEEHKEKLRKKRPYAGKNISEGKSFEWIVSEKETGKMYVIKNLNAFCRDNGLAPGNLYKTLTGEIKFHKGYSIKHHG